MFPLTLPDIPTDLRIIMIAVSIAALVIGMLLAKGWFTFVYIRPLKRLSETIRLFNDGNWEQRAWIEGNNEVARLSEMLNQMTDELAETYHTLEVQLTVQSLRYQILSEFSQSILPQGDLSELLKQSTQFIGDHFACTQVEIILGPADSPRTEGGLLEPVGDQKPTNSPVLRFEYTAPSRRKTRLQGEEICFPIRVAGKRRGLLRVRPGESETISADSQKDIQILADLLDFPIQAAELSESQHTGRSFHWREVDNQLQEMTNRICNATDIQAMLQAAAVDLGEVLGEPHIRITIQDVPEESTLQSEKDQ